MQQAEAVFTRAGFTRGLRKILPFTIFVIPFGMAFGAAALERGMEAWVAVVMSATSFAGAAQFAVLELWSEKVPLLPLVLITFAVNARHLLMGASLLHWMRPVGWPRMLLTVSVTSDPNFALITAARRGGERDVAMLLGTGLALWTAWTLGTILGVGLGKSIGDPRALGIDVLMPGFFTALLVGMWRGRQTLAPWLAAAAVALLASALIPGYWHIVIGALAGGLVGAFTRDA